MKAVFREFQREEHMKMILLGAKVIKMHRLGKIGLEIVKETGLPEVQIQEILNYVNR